MSPLSTATRKESAMDISEAKKQQQQTSEWAACDPFTLVSAARSTLYGEVQPQHSSGATLKPLEEIISRFEQQTRASLGSSVPAAAGR
jgi:hypothetical protein